MNRKLVAFVFVSVIAGIGVGLGLGMVLQRTPAYVSQLESEVSTLQSELATLNTTYCELEANHTSLIEALDLQFMRMMSYNMAMTISFGDLLVITSSELEAPYDMIDVGYTNGTIVAYWRDPVGKPGELIVQRVVKKEYKDGKWHFTTHADNNIMPNVVERFSEEYLFGRVIAIISDSSE